jgi:hypothetical protein
MEKNVKGDSVYYQIAWSPIIRFDKYRALGIPDLSGIICLIAEKSKTQFEYLLFYSCWRNSLRKGLRDITDPLSPKFPGIIGHVEKKTLLYKYTVIDKSPRDMNDIMYWLIKEYLPEYNNSEDFIDSGRYKDIYMKESSLKDGDIFERIRKNDV